MDDPEGSEAVSLARASIEGAVRGTDGRDPAAAFRDRPLPPLFDLPRGVFVTLKRWPSEQLRGCIGYPLPVFPLRVALARAARAAALEDPRFPPVRPSEVEALTVEVSVLTLPEPLPGPGPEERLAGVRVGRDGLIVERGSASGLLLPQVAVEEGWNALELLEGTSVKAGLPRDAWRSPTATVRRFEAEVFGERSPRGPVGRRESPSVG